MTETTFELATSFELLVRFQSKASRSTGSGEEEGLLGLSGISYLEWISQGRQSADKSTLPLLTPDSKHLLGKEAPHLFF